MLQVIWKLHLSAVLASPNPFQSKAGDKSGKQLKPGLKLTHAERTNDLSSVLHADTCDLPSTCFLLCAEHSQGQVGTVSTHQE